MARAARWLATLGAVPLFALVPTGSATASATATSRVDAREFSFRISRAQAPAGTKVTFVVRNRGKVAHRFRIAGKRTRLLQPGASQSVSVTFQKGGKITFVCTVRRHAKKGMRGTFTVTRRIPPEPEQLKVTGSAVLTPIATVERPVAVTAPPGDASRVFVVEQSGTVRVIQNGVVQEQPFLDIRHRVKVTSESGLLSLAFAPDYAQSGLFYVYYNQPIGSGDARLAEWRRHSANPAIADPDGDRTILTVPKPWENHNGGMLQFGPDGTLYAAIGDGDSGVIYPSGHFSQGLDSLLGKIVRIDPRGGDPYAVPGDNPFVGVPGARPEIWAYGLRNPWRFWLDAPSGQMFVADVGEGRREEIDLLPAGAKGLNFGWPCFEGEIEFRVDVTCADAVAPLLSIPRENGICAIIGGVVARDSRIPALQGRYLYGDFCLGRIFAIEVKDGQVTASDDLGVDAARLSSFGVDGLGRIYATSTRGEVWRLDPAPSG